MSNETQHTPEKDLLELIEGNIASCNNFECSVIDCDRMNVELIKKYSLGIAYQVAFSQNEYLKDRLAKCERALNDSVTNSSSLLKENQELKERLNQANISKEAFMKESIKLKAENERFKAINEELVNALQIIADWKLPESGKSWDDDTPMSYEAAYGSNGARDFIRSVAEQALSKAKT